MEFVKKCGVNLAAKIRRIMKSYMIILPISAITICVSLPKGANAQLAVLEVIKAGVKNGKP